ncbi:MAG TPA: sigma-70 family RNA polymerase sigma factor [Phycisphaerae bacterium]|nr:sigma-70 family RNA polymerase sigma factor [Phycisphaerae bacterium]
MISPNQAARFKRLAWPFMSVVLRTSECLTRSSDQAEDLAQETMLKALRAIDSYQDDTDMRAWLLTIMRRTHIDCLRAVRNRPLQLSLDGTALDLPDNEDPPSGRLDEQWEEPEELMDRFDDETVIEAMRALPNDIRWTLLLVDIEQMAQADAAAVLGVPVGTIKSRAHRGRAMLRDQLCQFALQRGWLRKKEGAE